MKRLKINVGDKFNSWTILQEVNKRDIGGNLRRYVLCQCDCGTNQLLLLNSLTSNNSKSCGCKFKSRHKTHQMTNSREYIIWASMKQRCLNKNEKSYERYGKKGITICNEWLKFENFYKDMGPAPTNKHQIDRKDTLKGYYKENCRWVMPIENARNKQNNYYWIINNIEYPSLNEAAIANNVSTSTIQYWCGYRNYKKQGYTSKTKLNCYRIPRYPKET